MNVAHAIASLAAVPLLGAASSNLGGLPLLLVALACPLMMVVMMRTMGGMGHHDGGKRDSEPPPQDEDIPDRVPDTWTRDR